MKKNIIPFFQDEYRQQHNTYQRYTAAVKAADEASADKKTA
jgi:hypothetical protein